MRIVAALLIISHHFARKGGAVEMASGINRIWSCIMNAGGQLGVNVFVLLGAYFLTDGEFRVLRIIRIWLETLFYSVSISLLCAILQMPNADMSRDALFKGLFPIFGYPYWFVSAYLGMLLCTPFLNFFISKFSKKRYRYMLWVMTLLLSIIPSILTWTTGIFCSNIIWFIYLYFLMGYLKKYKITIKKMEALLIFVSSYGVIWLTEILFPIYGSSGLAFSSIIDNLRYYYINKHTFPMLVASISFFYLFSDMKIQYNRVINKMASTTLGVYLIHTHNAIKEKVVWENFFNVSSWYNSRWFVVRSILCVITIFFMCALIDWFRMKMIERWIVTSKRVHKICDKIDEFMKYDE